MTSRSMDLSKFNPEQRQAMTLEGSNLLVSASAGSGKTTVLIERIFRKITDQALSLDQLLVVTFTEAAAKEMKDKMESRLKNAISQASNSALRSHYLKQIDLLPQAHIRTLHSFCLQVIQAYFYLIDLDPDFRLLTDETELRLIYMDVWEELVKNISSGGQASQAWLTYQDYQDLLGRYGGGKGDESLFNLVINIFEYAMSHPNPKSYIAQLNSSQKLFENFSSTELFQEGLAKPLKHILKASLEDLKLLIKEAGQLSVDKYQKLLLKDYEHYSTLLNLLDQQDLEALNHYAWNLKFSTWSGKVKDEGEQEKVSEIKTERDRLKKQVKEKYLDKIFIYPYPRNVKIEADTQTLIEKIKALLSYFMDLLESYKKQERVLSFSDLEHLALEILAPLDEETQTRQMSPAATHYQGLFQEVLVDEYQDINEIQALLLNFLSHNYREDLNNNLFMVGDVKQSIYSFRMAEPSLFMQLYRDYQKAGPDQLIVLGKNYRSRHEVLNFTNFLFERIMDLELGDMIYGPKEALVTGNHSFQPEVGHPDFKIELLVNDKANDASSGRADEENAKAEEEGDPSLFDEAVEKEAHIIAQKILNMMNQGFMIFDKSLENEDEKLRPLKFSDIVILSSTKQVFLSLQAVFADYEIPLMVQQADSYFQRYEVQIMLALLKVIDNPLQDIPYVACLRSFFVGLDDEALSQIRIYSPEGTFYQASLSFCQADFSKNTNQRLLESIQKRLKVFHDQLEAWRKHRQQSTLVDLIWEIYQETSFLPFVSGLKNGRQRRANLHAFYQRAEAFQEGRFKGLSGFIRYIEAVMKNKKDLAEPIQLEGDQNFVRAMTVHASKGLEFPCVFLMNLNKGFNTKSLTGRPYSLSKHYGLAIDSIDEDKNLKYRSMVRYALVQTERTKLLAEEMRKLYVALTRAQQKLILVASIDDRAKWEETLSGTANKELETSLVIPYNERFRAKSWLDWIHQALSYVDAKPADSLCDFKKEDLSLQFFKDEDLLAAIKDQKSQAKTSKENWQANFWKQVQGSASSSPWEAKLEKMWEASYPYELATRSSSYQSVSELKRLLEEPRIEKLDTYIDRRPRQEAERPPKEGTDDARQAIRFIEDAFKEPKFFESKSISSAELGSLNHYFL